MDLVWQPLAWIVAPLALAAVWWHVVWWLRSGSGPSAPWLRRLATAREPWPTVARVAYLAGIPLLALTAKVVTPEALGLVATADSRATLTATAVAVAIASLGLASRWWFLRALRQPQHWVLRPPGMAPLGHLVLTALGLELHRALFRAGFLSLSVGTAGQAVLVAVGLLAIEGCCDPARRAQMDDPAAARQLAEGANLALLGTAAYLVTGSSVVAWMLHLGVRYAWTALRPVRPPPGQPDGAVAVEPTIA